MTLIGAISRDALRTAVLCEQQLLHNASKVRATSIESDRVSMVKFARDLSRQNASTNPFLAPSARVNSCASAQWSHIATMRAQSSSTPQACARTKTSRTLTFELFAMSEGRDNAHGRAIIRVFRCAAAAGQEKSNCRENTRTQSSLW